MKPTTIHVHQCRSANAWNCTKKARNKGKVPNIGNQIFLTRKCRRLPAECVTLRAPDVTTAYIIVIIRRAAFYQASAFYVF